MQPLPGSFDIHTHTLPRRVARRTLERLGKRYNVTPQGQGTAEDLLERLDSAGIEHGLVLCLANSPAQVITANKWAVSIQTNHPRLRAFGSLHPEFEAWERELEKLRQAGIRGLKFHPGFQSINLDDPRLRTILEVAARDFILLFHVNDTPDSPCGPDQLASLADMLPGATIIAAHMGGFRQKPGPLNALIGRDIYIDTSYSLDRLDPASLRRILEIHPREKILFGSDYPIFDPALELEKLRARFRLSDTEIERLLTNAAPLFNS